jgi:hypothetical protein
MKRLMMFGFCAVTAAAITAGFSMAAAPTQPAVSFKDLQTESLSGRVDLTPGLVDHDTVISVSKKDGVVGCTYGTIGSSVRNDEPHMMSAR